MMKEHKDTIYRAILLFVILLTIFLINSIVILKKVEKDRNQRIAELELQIKNLQSRINLNVSRIENLSH